MATHESFRRYTRNDRTSASDQNRLREAVENLQRGGGVFARRMQGVLVPLEGPERWFLIQLDSISDGATPRPKYVAWHEVDLAEDGSVVQLADTLVGSASLPAYSESGYDAPPAVSGVGAVYLARMSMQEQAVIFFAYPVAAPLPPAIEVKEADGSPDYTGVSVLIFDQADGFVLSQPALGQTKVNFGSTDPDASLTVRGYVNLSPQSLGAGAKYFSDKIGVGTASPLANSAIDVRGYTYVYFAGAVSFGGGNFPASEAAGAIMQYDSTSHNITLTIAAADYTSGRVGGVMIRGNDAKFVLRHKTATTPRYSYLNDDTATYTDGSDATFTLAKLTTGGANGSATFKGGILTAYTPPT